MMHFELEKEKYLLKVFKQKEAGLLLEGVCDNSNKRDIIFVLDPQIPATVNYNKKERRFTHIGYLRSGETVFIKL